MSSLKIHNFNKNYTGILVVQWMVLNLFSYAFEFKRFFNSPYMNFVLMIILLLSLLTKHLFGFLDKVNIAFWEQNKIVSIQIPLQRWKLTR